jgi:hypothetical protein
MFAGSEMRFWPWHSELEIHLQRSEKCGSWPRLAREDGNSPLPVGVTFTGIVDNDRPAFPATDTHELFAPAWTRYTWHEDHNRLLGILKEVEFVAHLSSSAKEARNLPTDSNPATIIWKAIPITNPKTINGRQIKTVRA